MSPPPGCGVLQSRAHWPQFLMSLDTSVHAVTGIMVTGSQLVHAVWPAEQVGPKLGWHE